MTDQQHKKLKRRISELVKRNGIPIRTQNILRRLSLPDGADIDGVLTEMVTEGHLQRSPTLLVNGEVGHIYDVGTAQ
jgi:hypothetical protein